jgi:hypothetical protein
MANNKYAGYTPDPSKQKRGEGSTEINNRLDRFNPYEFRKGMDYELTSIGCARLAESTIEEREKCTEVVLKNLEEHGAYYSALIQYTAGMNQAGKIDKMTFKKYLEENFPNTSGTGMVEVDKEIKNDKMTDAKPNDINTIKMKTVQPLKEAIKREIKNILEAKDKDEFDGPEDEDFDKGVKKAMGKKKKKDRGDELDDELNKLKAKKDDFEEKHEKAKEKSFPTYQKNKDTAAYKKALSLKDKDINDLKKLANTYTGRESGYNIPANVTYKEAITLLDKRVTANKREQEQFLKDTLKEKRDVSKMEMSRKDHMRLLEIIKEYGVNLKEGSNAIRMHYEIAKASYLEGIAKGMKI